MMDAQRKVEEEEEGYEMVAMDVRIIDKKDRKIVVQIDDIDISFANALRRIMLNEIPVLSIDDVNFIDNNSGFYDEILAHRLGLIPLTFSNLNLKSECKCNGKGCINCEVSISLNKKGPCVVKAGDIISSLADVNPLDPEILLVELLEGQSVKLEAIARLGLGSDHAKWQPAVVGYRYFPIVRTKDKEDLAPALKICPQGVYGKKDGSIGVVKSINCDLCMRCTEVTDSISISYDDTKFIFTIESVSGMSAEDIFIQALDILGQKSKDFIKTVKSEL